jgi:hypothetical protein
MMAQMMQMMQGCTNMMQAMAPAKPPAGGAPQPQQGG